jgi:quinoprotein glucose dehydrogenase
MMIVALLLAVGQDALDDPEDAAARLQPAPGLRVSVFASEPDVVNPVGLHVDDRGRVFVAETRRYNTSALYVKQRPTWYFDDLACRTVEDRLEVARKFMGDEAAKLEVDSEIVRLLEDTDRDGAADRASVYADGFRSRLDGVASGVIARGDSVWLANVPDLWRLRGEGKSTSRERLQHGYGVRFGNSGHDLHGLCFGPDGKLYFSMGDRGLHVETPDGPVSAPDRGAVLRCAPDGTGLELFATGLRNPQGLTFDALGNLWTVDNNADMGDPARCLHVVEGGDYGWRVSYQYATEPWAAQELKPGFYLTISKDNPWIAEEIWSGKAAYAMPNAGKISNGPCGLAAYPGTGLTTAYDGRLFLCDFPGGVHTFAVRPDGASYVLEDPRRFLWGGWPTDAKFGPDGALYVADWVYGFPMTGKGRIFRVADPEASRDPLVAETRALLAEGMEKKDVDALIRLLGHRDLRVRQNAQFALAERAAADALTKAVAGGPRPARLHALWALGQIGDTRALPALLRDADPELRANAAKILGDRRAACDGLAALVRDPSLRVRFHALMALGKIGGARAAALETLRDADPWLRHAAVFALARGGDPDALVAAAENQPAPVRLGILLALRRLESPALARFLADADPSLVFEAARAIHDAPVAAALPAVADLLRDPRCPEPALSRALSAAFRRDAAGDAAAVAGLAVRPGAPAVLRAEALGALAAWERPSSRERVTGAWRPLRPRDPAAALAALDGIFDVLWSAPEEDVRRALIRAAAALGLARAAGKLEDLARSAGPAASRVEALRALFTLDAPRGDALLERLAEDVDVAVRGEAVRQAPRLRPSTAAALLRRSAEDGPVPVRQAALAALARVPGVEADAALEAFLERRLRGELPAALHLDLAEAAARRTSPGLLEKLARVEATRPADDPLRGYRDALEGGDAAIGRKIFNERSTVACLRCHKAGASGGEVGPPLAAIGKERTAEQLLESIVFPNRQIAPGYGQEIVRTTSGAIEVGRVKSDVADELVLIRADGREKRFPKASIAGRKAGLSAMPDDLVKSLTPRDLRDLVAFLRSLR